MSQTLVLLPSQGMGPVMLNSKPRWCTAKTPKFKGMLTKRITKNSQGRVLWAVGMGAPLQQGWS